MTNSTPKEIKRMLTIPEIARELRRTRQGVMYALATNNIAPEAEAGRVRFFNPDVVPKLREIMRKPNRTSSTSH